MVVQFSHELLATVGVLGGWVSAAGHPITVFAAQHRRERRPRFPPVSRLANTTHGVRPMSVQPSARLAVEQLDQRDVPAVFNLTTAGSQAVTSGFIAQQIDGAPIQDFTRFVRFAGGSIEQGYNTTGNSQFDEIRGPNIHPALTLGQIPTVTIGGVTYREFILNINQSILSPRLSVDELQIFTASGSNLHNYRPGQDELRGATRVFDMDAGPNHTILLNGNLNRG